MLPIKGNCEKCKKPSLDLMGAEIPFVSELEKIENGEATFSTKEKVLFLCEDCINELTEKGFLWKE